MKVPGGDWLLLPRQADKAAELLEGCKDGTGSLLPGSGTVDHWPARRCCQGVRRGDQARRKQGRMHARKAGEIRKTGSLDEAEQIIRSTGSEGARQAEYSYQMGCVMADRGDTYGAIEYFERGGRHGPATTSGHCSHSPNRRHARGTMTRRFSSTSVACRSLRTTSVPC